MLFSKISLESSAKLIQKQKYGDTNICPNVSKEEKTPTEMLQNCFHGNNIYFHLNN